jgi:hypothetical protein
MKIFIKRYYLDAMILSGILLIITNHFFKLTEYKKITYTEYDMFDFAEDVKSYTSIHYDYVGFISVVLISIGLYIIIRRFITNKFF